jgi:hypothetical protein
MTDPVDRGRNRSETFAEFARAEGFSLSTFYKLKKLGLGPDVLHLLSEPHPASPRRRRARKPMHTDPSTILLNLWENISRTQHQPKLWKTPANQCTLTLLPFWVINIREQRKNSIGPTPRAGSDAPRA